jgi:hypothetical protein
MVLCALINIKTQCLAAEEATDSLGPEPESNY